VTWATRLKPLDVEVVVRACWLGRAVAAAARVRVEMVKRMVAALRRVLVLE
jgi:hypothetical protein